MSEFKETVTTKKNEGVDAANTINGPTCAAAVDQDETADEVVTAASESDGGTLAGTGQNTAHLTTLALVLLTAGLFVGGRMLSSKQAR